MYSVQIKQTMASIGIETQRARFEIQNPRPHLKIIQNKAQFKIHKRLPKFKMIQENHLVSSGRLTNMAFSLERFQKAREMTLEAIGRIASEGDALMRIENKGNPIPELAIQNSQDNVEINVGIPPQNKIEWDEGQFELEWSEQELKMDWYIEHKPKIIVHPHSIKIYVKNKPSIEISVKENKKGLKVDKKI